MRFELGHSVWFPSTTTVTEYITCPDCAGTRQIKCIIADGTEFAVDCRCCERGGWEGSRGNIELHRHSEVIRACVITGINVRDGVELYSSEGNFYEETGDNLFYSEKDAQSRAAELAKVRTAEDERQMLAKEKDTHSWAWHVTYHRRGLKEAERQAAYHTEKLTISKAKAKEA